jgi:hypothetical protein
MQKQLKLKLYTPRVKKEDKEFGPKQRENLFRRVRLMRSRMESLPHAA